MMYSGSVKLRSTQPTTRFVAATQVSLFGGMLRWRDVQAQRNIVNAELYAIFHVPLPSGSFTQDGAKPSASAVMFPAPALAESLAKSKTIMTLKNGIVEGEK